MKLSAKKKNELYEVIHEEIMQVRIKVWKMRHDAKPSISEIDNILSDLLVTAPQKAIDLFKE